MKKSLLGIIFILSAIISFAQVLGEGDLVPNINWKDSDGGEPQMKYLYDLTAQGKYVWIDFSSTQCGFCNLEAPVLEESWQKYGQQQGDVYVVTSMFYIAETGPEAPGFTWDELNGDAWRTKFDPPLTSYLCSKDTGLYNYMYNVPENPVNFGVEAFPRNILIGPDNTVLKYMAGFNMGQHEEIEETINTGLGIIPAASLAAVLNGTESFTLTWGVSSSSDKYDPIKYTIYRNGIFLTEISDISTAEYIDTDIELEMSYYYQITTTYQNLITPDLQIESLRSEHTENTVIGDLGVGEWMYYGTGPFSSQVGVSREFAYAIDFDFGSTEYEIKAIEVANRNNGTVDWRIVKLEDGLIGGGSGDPIHCGNELIGTLEGTIYTFANYEPVLHTINDTSTITGEIAVVAYASEGNKSLASNEEENHADWYTEILEDWNWLHLGADLSYPKTWYLKIFVQEKMSTEIKEFSHMRKVSDISVYPNPANGFVNIKMTDINTEYEMLDLKIVDLLGRTVYESTFDNSEKQIINTEGINGGVYHIVITTSNNIKTIKKLVIK